MRVPARWTWLVFALALFAPAALGTAQMPDFLLIDGERVMLHTNPLAEWLEDHPGALPPAKVDSSGNWRGYVATWEIDQDKLWLRKVEIAVGTRYEEEWDGVDETYPFVLQDVIGRIFPGERAVLADWFTGTLIVPRGKVVERVHMGYGSTHERYTILWIRGARLSRRLDLDAQQFVEFRKERFEAFKKTEAYRKALASLGGEQGAPGETERFLFEFHSEQYLSEDPGPASR